MNVRFRKQSAVFVCCAVTVLGLVGAALQAAPVAGEQFHLPQPDGSWIDVRIWGDEYYGVTETLDGYSLVRDPVTHFLCYASLTPDGDDLESTGVPAGDARPAKLVPHLRINADAARAKARAARAQWRLREQIITGGGAQPGPARGAVQGICLIIDFSDDAGTISPAAVTNYCNQAGYTGYGDNGSVRDYYYDVSEGALTYTNFVPDAYFRAAHPKSYYTDPSIPYGQRASELIEEALVDLDNHGFDFSRYDSDGDGWVDALNCFYAGDIWNNWAEGLWPHSGSTWFCADGVCAYGYQMTNMGGALYLRTFCHENGHMLMHWPDLYDYDYDSTGVGRYCLMAYSTSDTNPCEPCAYMKYASGWTQTTLLTVPRTGLSLSAASTNQCYKFERPGHANEYYLVENRQQTGRDVGLPDRGLAIWHIDTEGNNSDNEMLPDSHFLVTLVQADGRWDLEHNANYGDSTDLWATPGYAACTPTSNPNTNWWDGSASGLAITNISTSSGVMTFDFAAGDQVLGDLDGDGDVDLGDLAQLLSHYGMANASYADGDLDGDGDVDLADLAALLGNYGYGG